jgi:hypothetical protein
MSKSGGKSVAIYHAVRAHEGFEKAAQTIFELVREAQRKQPGRPRVIYLDIEGHRNNQGGFDTDMLELQQEFLIGFLGDYVTELVLPLIRVANKRPQNDEVPDRLGIQERP